jgi:hypothetical protein
MLPLLRIDNQLLGDVNDPCVVVSAGRKKKSQWCGEEVGFASDCTTSEAIDNIEI